MKRRNFLGMLGLAPVVASVPVVASEKSPVVEFKDDQLRFGTIISADGRVVMKTDQIIIYS